MKMVVDFSRNKNKSNSSTIMGEVGDYKYLGCGMETKSMQKEQSRMKMLQIFYHSVVEKHFLWASVCEMKELL